MHTQTIPKTNEMQIYPDKEQKEDFSFPHEIEERILLIKCHVVKTTPPKSIPRVYHKMHMKHQIFGRFKLQFFFQCLHSFWCTSMRIVMPREDPKQHGGFQGYYQILKRKLENYIYCQLSHEIIENLPPKKVTMTYFPLEITKLCSKNHH